MGRPHAPRLVRTVGFHTSVQAFSLTSLRPFLRVISSLGGVT